MKRLLRLALALATLLVLSVAALYAVSTLRLSRTFAIDAPRLEIPDDAESIARGEHLLTLAKCGECHGEDLGGKVILDEPFLARLSGPNLTPAGPVGTRSDAELLQSIRYGLSVEGKPLLGMPTAEHFHFSDEEMASMMAAIRALEPVHRELPSQKVGIVFRALYLAGEIELVGQDQVDIYGPRPSAVRPGLSKSYGEHLARTGGCYSCHGSQLAGGPMAGAPPHFPPASNLTPHSSGLAEWSEEDFIRAMRKGQRPDGTAIDAAMPWRYTREMTDQELAALWMYLQAVASVPYSQN